MTDPKAEAPQPSRQDLQDTDPTQGHQAATQDLHHLCNKGGVTDTPDPRRELRGQSGADPDPDPRHLVATDLLLEDTEAGPPLPDTDPGPDLRITTGVDLDLPDTLDHPRHTVVVPRQGVRLRHLIQQGPGLRSRGIREKTSTLFINKSELHFRIGMTCAFTLLCTKVI